MIIYLNSSITLGLRLQPSKSIFFSIQPYYDANGALDLDDRRLTLGAIIFLRPSLVS